uniref:Putative secreted protein n=1 Tax=Anopheles marajoara TaxID=58244 RepID=A0A2M4C7J5_9DIPT
MRRTSRTVGLPAPAPLLMLCCCCTIPLDRAGRKLLSSKLNDQLRNESAPVRGPVALSRKRLTDPANGRIAVALGPIGRNGATARSPEATEPSLSGTFSYSCSLSRASCGVLRSTRG